MCTSFSIYHRFDIKIQHRKSVVISSIMKEESTWKGNHPFNVDNMLTPLLKSIDQIRMMFSRAFFDVVWMLAQRNF